VVAVRAAVMADMVTSGGPTGAVPVSHQTRLPTRLELIAARRAMLKLLVQFDSPSGDRRLV
jgi:hypothetical protein